MSPVRSWRPMRQKDLQGLVTVPVFFAGTVPEAKSLADVEEVGRRWLSRRRTLSTGKYVNTDVQCVTMYNVILRFLLTGQRSGIAVRQMANRSRLC